MSGERPGFGLSTGTRAPRAGHPSRARSVGRIRSRVGPLIAATGLAISLGPWVAAPVFAATFDVFTTSDSGTGSLRQAILDANASPGADTITFSFEGPAPYVIEPTSPLPAITDTVVIASTVTVDGGGPAVVIDGSSAAGTNGLVVQGAGSDTEIRGLRIIDFSGSGVYLNGVSGVVIEGDYIGTDGAVDQGNGQAGITLVGADGSQIIDNLISGNGQAPGVEPCCSAGFGIWLADAGAAGNTITGNRIGTNAAGSAAIGNGTYGIVVSSPDNQIGGTTAADRNLISGNGRGVQFAGGATQGNVFEGNYVGTNAAGTAALGNGVHGVLLNLTNDALVIGGTAAGAGNVIASSASGIVLGSASNAIVQGNLIGVGADRATPLGNVAVGIQITGNSDFPANANTIGGTVPGAGNVIAHNGGATGDGVQISGVASGNRVLGNVIRDNGGLGIDLGTDGVTANDAGDGDTGANALQNFPVISDTLPTDVSGTLDSTSGTYRIEIYANSTCDPSGNGEGATLIKALSGVVAGPFSADVPVVNGTALTATATNEATGDTSEFGPCHLVTNGLPAPGVWQGSKSASTAGTFIASGSGAAGPAHFSYDVPDADPEFGNGESGEWQFYTTAAATSTVEIPWHYTGFHAFFQVTVGLHAFVIRDGDTVVSDTQLVAAGPANCCTTPSAGFDYAGSVTFSVQPGDVYGFTITGANGDSNETLRGDLFLGPETPLDFATPVLFAAIATGSDSAYLIGRVDGASNTTLTLEVSRSTTCTDGALVGGAVATGSPISGVVTDVAGYFGVLVSDIPSGRFVTARVTIPDVTPPSTCVRSSANNDYWPKALEVTGTSVAADDVIDVSGKSRWYRFEVDPGQRITVSLSGLPADYDLAVFKDIGQEFLNQLVPQTAQDLTKLSAEYAPAVFSPAVFSPAVFSPAVFSPDAYSPAVFSPAVFSPAVFSPAVFSPAVFSPAVFSPAVFSPAVFSPAVFSPAVFSPAVFSPAVFSPAVFSPEELAQAFSSAQTRSIIGVSATPGTGNETVVVNSWNNSGEFYVRVAGHNGAFDPNGLFTVTVAKGATSCAGVTDQTLTARTDQPGTNAYNTVILTDSSKLALGDGSVGTLRKKLTDFAARPEVKGVIVDVAIDTRVGQLQTQAANNTACPYAMNLVAGEIKGIVDSYRKNNPLKYVVIAGGDDVIPFFRYPDQSLLGQESGYVPPVVSTSPSEAALRRDFVLSQDAYGAGIEVSLRTSDFPVPGLAVGRLVETPTEVAGMLDAYTATNGVVAPGSSLVTGYDFLADAADAVKQEFQAGTGATPDTLVTPNGVSPQDPTSWTASQLSTKLLGSRHDVIFLAGHFSANSALAADFQTSLLTTDLAASSVNLTNAIVFSAGCHSGYNLVDGAAVTGVTLPLDWSQAFAQKRATLVAGTGYQYGDTDFLEYSERLYRDFAKQLHAGTGAIPIGEALVKAKLQYMATTPDIRGIHEKALLEATLFGLPMLGVNMPAGRGAGSGSVGVITPTPVPSVNGTDLQLATADLLVTPTLTPASKQLTNPPYDAVPPTYTTARWLTGPGGAVVTNPAEPAVPLQTTNVTPTDGTKVLRGVGFRGGDFTDTLGIVPLTGAPTTELRGVHAPFVSPVFYPMRLWQSNYYGALGGTGGTNLLVTPVQHKTDDAVALTSVQRKYTGLDLKLFYSGNLTSAALSDAPTIVSVDAATTGSDVAFTAQVVGDPKATIQQVWITYTDKTATGAGNGTWRSLDLQQCVVVDPLPLPTVCGGTEDSRLWKGTRVGAPVDMRFVVQAANGLGLVSFDDNWGTYYSASASGAPATPAATTLTLISPPSGGTFGDVPTITAELKRGTTALANKVVTIVIGGAGAVGVTGSDGRVALKVALNAIPGSSAITASFGGDDDYAASSDSRSPFTIARAPTSFSSFTPFVTTTSTNSGGVVTTLSALVGGKTQPLIQRTVTVGLTGPVAKTISAITNYLGQVTLPLGLPAGTYTVSVSFSGDETYTSASRGPGTVVIAPFTGFFSPVDNQPVLNVTKAGSTIPVKFSLGGDRGLAIFASGYPGATKIACQGGAPVDPIEETNTSNSGLTYDATTNQYKYNWKTPKSYVGSCYRLDLRFVDGRTYSANFQFK